MFGAHWSLSSAIWHQTELLLLISRYATDLWISLTAVRRLTDKPLVPSSYHLGNVWRPNSFVRWSCMYLCLLQHVTSIACLCYNVMYFMVRLLSSQQVTWLASPRSEAQALLCLFTTLWAYDHFSSSSVVSRAFSPLCVYSKFGHHTHPLGYPCANFRFFRGPHCWASPWIKIAYSINHSPSLFDAPRTDAVAFRNKIGL